MTFPSAGGGGGGGYANLISDLFVIPGQNYSLRAGRGGDNGAFNTGQGNGGKGQNSFFTHNGTAYVSNGGGGGGGGSSTPHGSNGGNGGGGGAINISGTGASATQGFGGGNAAMSGSNREGGGGGGSTELGRDAAINGQDGVGGSGFNLQGWMGTANYRTTVTKTDATLGELTKYNSKGVGGGGGGGRTTSPIGYITGEDGGGYGCFPSDDINNRGDQFRDGLNRTGGGGGGGCWGNGAGHGGSGVVIVRYQGLYRRDISSGDYVEYRTGTVGGIPYQFVVFGRSEVTPNVYDQTLDEIFTPNPNPVFAPA